MHDDFTVPADWYRTFFTGPVNAFWEAMVSPAATEADLAFIRRHIGPAPARVLDTPCGAGRHALGLARAGYHVTGIDISAEAIARASRAAERLPVRFLCGDMAAMEPGGDFDAAICFGNSLGYFGPEETRAFLSGLAGSLKQGGRLLLDTYTAAESIFPLQEDREIAFDGGTYRSRYSYDPYRSVLKTSAELTLEGEVHPLLYAHYVLTSGELVRMVERAGVQVVSLYADTKGGPYAPGLPRLLLVGTRC